MNNRIFSARLAALLCALGVFLFALSVLLGAYEEPIANKDERAGAGAFSISSLGYAALHDLLSQSGMQVKRAVDIDNIEPLDLLVYAEPGDKSLLQGNDLPPVKRPRTLVVLPKWKAIRDPGRSKWIMGIKSVPFTRIREVIVPVLPDAHLVRADWPGHWKTNEIGIHPKGRDNAHLIVSTTLRPLVANENGILLGEIPIAGGSVWVLSDPDVMANHGLIEGDNAAFMLAVFQRLGEGGAIVFDETIHGYRERPAMPLRLLFEFPLVLATVLACLSALLLVWAGASRFGRPENGKLRLGFGKESLIDSTARLMAYSGHQRSVLKNHIALNLKTAAEALHAPPDLGETALAEWLDRFSRGDTHGLSCREILQRMRTATQQDGEAALLDCARDMHRWRETVVSARIPASAARTGKKAAHHTRGPAAPKKGI